MRQEKRTISGTEILSHSGCFLSEFEGRDSAKKEPIPVCLSLKKTIKSIQAHERGSKKQVLNDKPNFDDLNPSLEHIVLILYTPLDERIKVKNIAGLHIVLRGNENAWASYSVQKPNS